MIMIYIFFIGLLFMGVLIYFTLREGNTKVKDTAIDFAEWCNSNEYYYLADHLWAKNNPNSTEPATLTTERLWAKYDEYLIQKQYGDSGKN